MAAVAAVCSAGSGVGDILGVLMAHKPISITNDSSSD